MTVDTNKALRGALDYLQQGDWEAAHRIVQLDDSMTGCWIHGIVHVMEGDLENARYWYGRAGRPLSEDTAAEIVAVRASME